ncbi:MAG: hypothetical protein AAGF12_38780 [Myxococcota bacterium]
MRTLALLLALTGCTDTLDSSRTGEEDTPVGADPTPVADPAGPTGATGGEDNTFDHPEAIGGESVTAQEALQRINDEGPPGYTARVHGCRKIPYRTLGRVLSSRGVDLQNETQLSAGRMYRESDQALGAGNYGARIAETAEGTVASASRMFDIFVQAAPEIIAAVENLEACRFGGSSAQLFDPDGSCREDGLTCLMGEPATPDHVSVCSDMVTRAASIEEGQAIAVATILSASNTCE